MKDERMAPNYYTNCEQQPTRSEGEEKKRNHFAKEADCSVRSAVSFVSTHAGLALN